MNKLLVINQFIFIIFVCFSTIGALEQVKLIDTDDLDFVWTYFKAYNGKFYAKFNDELERY